MAKVAQPAGDEADELLRKLRPVLMEAIRGNFSSRIKMKEGDPYNEIYAGVQALLDVICEQIKVLDELGPQSSKWETTVYTPSDADDGTGDAS
jgi:hypothetical protein